MRLFKPDTTKEKRNQVEPSEAADVPAQETPKSVWYLSYSFHSQRAAANHGIDRGKTHFTNTCKVAET